MSVEEKLGIFFRPEQKRKGNELFRRELVTVTQKSDTQIRAFVKKTPPPKISLIAEDVGSSVFVADCTCSASSRGQLCEHIWATLVTTEEIYPDFLEARTDIEKAAKIERPKSTYQVQQDEYRKLKSENMKLKAKARRAEKKTSRFEKPAFPEEVAGAALFFEENGFPMANPIDVDTLTQAKKKLSRIFHPDRGGSHDEAVALNENFEILMIFAES
jgi:hypothetical protein